MDELVVGMSGNIRCVFQEHSFNTKATPSPAPEPFAVDIPWALHPQKFPRNCPEIALIWGEAGGGEYRGTQNRRGKGAVLIEVHLSHLFAVFFCAY